MPKVKCSVANCAYYGNGNVCNAESIMVETEQNNSNNFNEEFGSMEESNTANANCKEETVCATFKAK